MLCRTRHTLQGMRYNLFHQGNEIQTDFVTQGIVLKISRVCHIVLSDGMEEILYLLTTDTKQRTHDISILGTNTRQTMNTCTSH